MKNKANIPRPLGIIPHEILIALRPLLLRITRKHTLQTDTHTLDVVNRRPTGTVEQIEADDAVGVDVGVHWNRTVGLLVEGYLWGFCRPVSIFAGTKRQRRHTYGIHLGEVELETIDLIFVKRILVEHLDVDEPVAGNAVVSLYQCDPRRHSVLVHLWGTMSVESIHVLAYEGTREIRTNLA